MFATRSLGSTARIMAVLILIAAGVAGCGSAGASGDVSGAAPGDAGFGAADDNVARPDTAPLITGITGALADRSLVTIRGKRFGTKPTAAPVGWQDLESGALAPNGVDDHGFNNHGALAVDNTNPRHARSRYNASGNFGTVGESVLGFHGGVNSRAWFAQYWFKLGSNWTWGDIALTQPVSNVKFFRIWSTGNEVIDWVQSWHGPKSTWSGVENGAPGGYWTTPAALGVPAVHPYITPDALPRDTWLLFQWQYSESSGYDVPDGTIKWWIDGKLALSRSDLVTKKDLDGYRSDKAVSLVGLYNSWGTGTPGSEKSQFYIDDVYIDNTWARVEIGDAPQYDSCTRREIQVPTAWSETAVTVRINQGGFDNFAGAYLYVLSPNGRPNPAGYPLQ